MQKDKYSVGFWDYKTFNQFDGKIPDVGPNICLCPTRTVEPTSRHDGVPLFLLHPPQGVGHQELPTLLLLTNISADEGQEVVWSLLRRQKYFNQLTSNISIMATTATIRFTCP